jgi:hypothetical protein
MEIARRFAASTAARGARIDLLFTMSDITRAAAKADNARIDSLTNEPENLGAVWWSQTGSNRRPPACKAGALPTELWPLKDRQQGSEISSKF